MRSAAEQRQFFCGPGRSWNIFELLCIVSMAIDCIDFEQYWFWQLHILTAVQNASPLRAARLVRSFRFMTPLRLMLMSVVPSMVSMMRAVLLLFVFVGLFALFLVDSALAHLREIQRAQNALDPKDAVVTS